MKKKMAILIILTMCFTILSCSNFTTKKRDRAVLESFIQDYYSQLTMTNSDWNEVKELVQANSNYTECKYIDKFKEIVSESCLERMIYNRQLPDFEMEKYDVLEIGFDGLTMEKKYEGTYHDLEKDEDVPFTIYEVNYTLMVTKKDTTTSFVNKSEVRLITKDERRMIDNLKEDFVWR